jgi:hypothetical protein
MKNKLYYFNALFDLELGGHSCVSLQRAASEMGVLFAPAGTSSDKIILDTGIDDSYWEYLHQQGIATATPFSAREGSEYEGVAWGWNDQSRTRLEKYGAICEAPSAECVKLVNSRKYCQQIGVKCGTGIPQSIYCTNKEQIVTAFKKLTDYFPLVIKPDHGNSGFGFYHCSSGDDLNNIDLEQLCKNQGVIVEPWCDKVYDFSSVCTINRDRSISPFRHLRAFTNNRGTFHGIYLAPHDPVIDYWRDILEENVLAVAAEVANSGYFGTLGFDSIVYRNNERMKLAAVIEINARHVMSDLAVIIRDRCAPQQHCLFRTLSKKRLRLPPSYQQLQQENDCFTFNDNKGCILITPLRVCHETQWVQPYRNTLFLAADSEEELFSLDQKLRAKTPVC